jgi:anti-anti-sigma factor
MSQEVSFTREEHDGGVVYHFEGDLDSYGTKQINQEFASVCAQDRSTHVIVDLAAVDYVASAALAMLIAHAQSMARAGGSLVVAGASEQAEGVFKLAGFDTVIPLHPDVESALNNRT